MPRLIDADALMIAIEKDFEGVCVYDVPPSEAVSDFERIVDSMPTIDAEPVRHGRWEEPYPLDIYDCYKCSCCGDTYDRTWNFCPNCGAKMDGEIECSNG